MTSDSTLVRVRPRRSVLTVAGGSLAVAVVPVTIMLVLVGSSPAGWLVAAVTELVAVLICVGLGVRQTTLFAAVTDRALEGNGFATPVVRVPLERIASVHLVETFVGQSGETVPQLLVLDAGGRRLFRLRGHYWPEGALERIAAALPVKPQREHEPMSPARFFARFPSSEYWFENKPWLRVVLIAAGAAVAVLVSLWVMAVIGTPRG